MLTDRAVSENKPVSDDGGFPFMLPLWSVKKPYTVLVAVILIVVLGIVSFSGMSTDLLPSLNLPYLVVLTSYPGGAGWASDDHAHQSRHAASYDRQC